MTEVSGAVDTKMDIALPEDAEKRAKARVDTQMDIALPEVAEKRAKARVDTQMDIALPEDAEKRAKARAGVVARAAEFPELEPKPNTAAAGSLNHLLDVSVSVTAEIGRVTVSIADILKFGPGSVVGLDRAVSEPIDLFVQGVPFARGEVVVIDDRFAIRIREIVDPKFSGKK